MKRTSGLCAPTSSSTKRPPRSNPPHRHRGHSNHCAGRRRRTAADARQPAELLKAFHQRHDCRENHGVVQTHIDDAQRFRESPGIGDSGRDHQDVIYARYQVKDDHATTVRNQFHFGIKLEAIRIDERYDLLHDGHERKKNHRPIDDVPHRPQLKRNFIRESHWPEHHEQRQFANHTHAHPPEQERRTEEEFKGGLETRNRFAIGKIRGWPQLRQSTRVEVLVRCLGRSFEKPEFRVADVQNGENDGHDGEHGQHRADVAQQRAQDFKKRFSLRDQHQHGNRVSKSHYGKNDFHQQPIEGEECGADQVARLAVARGYQQRMPVFLQDFRQFVFVQRAAERGLPVFDLPAQIFPKLFEDVLLLRHRQVRPNRLQVTLEKFHTMLLNNKLDGDPGEEGEHRSSKQKSRAQQREDEIAFGKHRHRGDGRAKNQNGQEVFHIRTTHLNNPLQRRIQAVPFLEQLLEDARPVLRKAIKPFVALVFLAPFAFQQALGFQPTQQRIQGALFDLHALVRQRLAQRIAVMLFAKLRQHRNDQRPAAEFHPQVFEKVGVREFGKVYHLGPPTVWRILCHTHYVVHSSCCQEKSWETYPTETAPDWLEVQ